LCGYNKNIHALDFAHIDPYTKINNVSRLLADGCFKQAKEEAMKCQILCANCHRERTWSDSIF